MILIVDDHPEAGRALCRALRERGYPAHHCAHGRDALQVLEEFRPSLLVVDDDGDGGDDGRTPDVGGLDVLAAVRRRGRPPGAADVPAVVLHAARDAAAARRRSAALGVSGYVLKGAGAALQLLALVEAILPSVAAG